MFIKMLDCNLMVDCMINEDQFVIIQVGQTHDDNWHVTGKMRNGDTVSIRKCADKADALYHLRNIASAIKGI